MNKRGQAFENLLFGMLLACIVAAALSSWVFAFSYVPSLDDAHASLVYAEADNPALAHLRSFKWFAESGLIVCFAMCLITMFWRRSYVGKGRMRWHLLIVLFLVAALWSLCGQLLPMDQHAYHGSVVRKGIVASAPIIGEQLRNLLFGSDAIDGTTLTRFFTLHVAILPMLLLAMVFLFLRFRGKGRAGMHGVGALIAALILVVVSQAVLIPLGIAARPDQPLADLRPEWFFLPLSLALQLGSNAQVIVHLAIILGLLLAFAWPFIFAKPFRHNIDRMALLLILGLKLGAMGWAIGQDAQHHEGYFARPDLEAVMHEMEESNELLGRGDQEVDLQVAATAVADMLILIEQTRSLSDHEDVVDAQKWEAWSDELRQLTLALWRDPERWKADDLRSKMRALCDDCHKLHEVEEDVWLGGVPLATQVEKSVKPLSEVTPPDSEAASRHSWLPFTPEDFEGLEADSRLPRRFGSLMKRMHEAYDALNAGGPAAAQALLDLQAYSKVLGPYYTSEGYDEICEKVTWTGPTYEMIAALREMRRASKESEYYAALDDVYKACGSCHFEFGVDEEEVELALPRGLK